MRLNKDDVLWKIHVDGSYNDHKEELLFWKHVAGSFEIGLPGCPYRPTPEDDLIGDLEEFMLDRGIMPEKETLELFDIFRFREWNRNDEENIGCD